MAMTLVFTDDFDKAKDEVESKEGRIIHRLGPGTVILSHPESCAIDEFATCASKMPTSLNQQEKSMVDAWQATRAC